MPGIIMANRHEGTVYALSHCQNIQSQFHSIISHALLPEKIEQQCEAFAFYVSSLRP